MKAQMTIINLASTAEWLKFVVEWLKFVADMTKALAWPMLVFIVVSQFRRPLLELLENLSTLEWGDKKAAFTRRVEAAAAAAAVTAAEASIDDKSRPRPSEAEQTGKAQREPIEDEAPVEPKTLRIAKDRHGRYRFLHRSDTEAEMVGSILEAWRPLEQALVDLWLSDRPGSNPQLAPRGRPLFNDLLATGKINSRTAVQLHVAQRLRNEAVHKGAQAISAAAVEEFHNLVHDLMYTISRGE